MEKNKDRMSQKVISNSLLFFILTYLYGPGILVNKYLNDRFPDAHFPMAGPTVLIGAFSSVLAAFAVAYLHRLYTRRKSAAKPDGQER